MLEIIITITIVSAAVFFLYRSTKKKSSGECDCGSCSSHCPRYREKK